MGIFDFFAWGVKAFFAFLGFAISFLAFFGVIGLVATLAEKKGEKE